MNVYKECLPNGGGGKPTGSRPATHSEPSAGTKGSGSSSTHPASSPVANVLKQAGSDRRALEALLGGNRRRLQASHGAAPATAPSAVGSAFDLGSGPTALLIALGGTAVLLLAGSGLRLWRGRHHA